MNKRKEYTMLEELRNFNAERSDLDDAVALYQFGVSLQNTYAELGLETPEWIIDVTVAIAKEVQSRARDQMQRELKKTEASLDSLKTAEEKRQDLRAKADRIRAKLAGF